jgi:hypothetical protein
MASRVDSKRLIEGWTSRLGLGLDSLKNVGGPKSNFLPDDCVSKAALLATNSDVRLAVPMNLHVARVVLSFRTVNEQLNFIGQFDNSVTKLTAALTVGSIFSRPKAALKGIPSEDYSLVCMSELLDDEEQDELWASLKLSIGCFLDNLQITRADGLVSLRSYAEVFGVKVSSAESLRDLSGIALKLKQSRWAIFGSDILSLIQALCDPLHQLTIQQISAGFKLASAWRMDALIAALVLTRAFGGFQSEKQYYVAHASSFSSVGRSTLRIADYVLTTKADEHVGLIPPFLKGFAQNDVVSQLLHLTANVALATKRKQLPILGVEHWHHDLWWLIAKAAIDGHPDNVKFNHHPALKKPAASRYAATTPKSLRWFDKHNDGLSYARKLKPFGFVSAFSARVLIDPPLSNSAKSNSWVKLQIKPVAPFHKNPAVAAQNAFDRITGEPTPVECLKTYQQALAQYHLHPEDKFLNGDFLDRGTTIRRHVRVTEIEYIGKESNKWEDQYYFGFDADEEIHYGTKPTDAGSLLKAIRAIVDAKGLRTTALQFRVSRSKLSKLLENELAGCTTAFLQRISRVVAVINSRRNQENKQNAELLKLANAEILKIGLAEFARRQGFNSSNLAKMASGKRSLSDSLLKVLKVYFGNNAHFDSSKSAS